MNRLILLTSILLMSCETPKVDASVKAYADSENLPLGVETFYDSKHGIRCYTLGQAISCVKNSEAK